MEYSAKDRRINLSINQKNLLQAFSRRPKPLALSKVYDILNKANSLGVALVHVYMGTEAVRILPYLRKRPKLVLFTVWILGMIFREKLQ